MFTNWLIDEYMNTGKLKEEKTETETEMMTTTTTTTTIGYDAKLFAQVHFYDCACALST